MPQSEPVIVAEVIRSGMVESRHRGSVVALDASGGMTMAVGSVHEPMYPRSTNKPGQATAMVGMGLSLKDELLALASASHSGEDFHLDGVRRILAGAGLDERALQNTPQWPVSEEAKVGQLRAGLDKSSLAGNCSGKHAAMLATCVVNGWSTDDYLDPRHPLQLGIRDTLDELSGEPMAHTGVDGCGAPLFAMTLVGVAQMFRQLAGGPVAQAIGKYPEWTSGTDRDEARLIRAVPGLFGKGGAEAVYGVGLPDGGAVALKIEDGGGRARSVVMEAVLRTLGIGIPRGEQLDDERIGIVRAVSSGPTADPP